MSRLRILLSQPETLWRVAVRKLDQLDSVLALEELSVPPGNHLVALSGSRAGGQSIRINDIVNGWRGITPSTALRLARFFGISADFWMNLQLRWDLYFAQKDETNILEDIHLFVPHTE